MAKYGTVLQAIARYGNGKEWHRYCKVKQWKAMAKYGTAFQGISRYCKVQQSKAKYGTVVYGELLQLRVTNLGWESEARAPQEKRKQMLQSGALQFRGRVNWTRTFLPEAHPASELISITTQCTISNAIQRCQIFTQLLTGDPLRVMTLSFADFGCSAGRLTPPNSDCVSHWIVC